MVVRPGHRRPRPSRVRLGRRFRAPRSILPAVLVVVRGERACAPRRRGRRGTRGHHRARRSARLHVAAVARTGSCIGGGPHRRRRAARRSGGRLHAARRRDHHHVLGRECHRGRVGGGRWLPLRGQGVQLSGSHRGHHRAAAIAATHGGGQRARRRRRRACSARCRRGPCARRHRRWRALGRLPGPSPRRLAALPAAARRPSRVHPLLERHHRQAEVHHSPCPGCAVDASQGAPAAG